MHIACQAILIKQRSFPRCFDGVTVEVCSLFDDSNTFKACVQAQWASKKWEAVRYKDFPSAQQTLVFWVYKHYLQVGLDNYGKNNNPNYFDQYCNPDYNSNSKEVVGIGSAENEIQEANGQMEVVKTAVIWISQNVQPRHILHLFQFKIMA